MPGDKSDNDKTELGLRYRRHRPPRRAKSPGDVFDKDPAPPSTKAPNDGISVTGKRGEYYPMPKRRAYPGPRSPASSDSDSDSESDAKPKFPKHRKDLVSALENRKQAEQPKNYADMRAELLERHVNELKDSQRKIAENPSERSRYYAEFLQLVNRQKKEKDDLDRQSDQSSPAPFDWGRPS